jgi:hypothetical protein
MWLGLVAGVLMVVGLVCLAIGIWWAVKVEKSYRAPLPKKSDALPTQPSRPTHYLAKLENIILEIEPETQVLPPVDPIAEARRQRQGEIESDKSKS